MGIFVVVFRNRQGTVMSEVEFPDNLDPATREAHLWAERVAPKRGCFGYDFVRHVGGRYFHAEFRRKTVKP